MSIIDAIHDHATGLFVLQMTAKVSVFLLIVIALDRVSGQRYAAIRNLVWKMAVIAMLLIPLQSVLSPALSVSVSPELGRWPGMSTLITATQTGTPFLQPPEPIAGAANLGDDPANGSNGQPVGWAGILAVTYGLGVIALFGRLLIGLYQSQAITRSSVPVEARWLEELQHMRARLGIRRPVRLCGSQLVGIPSQIGLWNPVVLLPARMLSERDGQSIRTAITHELVHVRRLDFLFNTLAALGLALHWPNPLAWFAVRRLRETGEHACDDSVVDVMGRHDIYAQALVSVAGRLKTMRPPAPAANMAQKRQIAGRIARIVRLAGDVSPRIGGIGIMLSLALFVCTTLVAASSLHALPDDRATPPSSTQAELMGRVEHFLLNNYRDITARRSIEWGDVVEQDGNRSIRYHFEARIWDKKTLELNQVFTFGPAGEFVDVVNVDGYPKEVVAKPIDVTTMEGIKERVELFFSRNFRNVTSRETIEWGDFVRHEDGSSSVRYKYMATIWDKDKHVKNQVFTFDETGEFVSVENVEE